MLKIAFNNIKKIIPRISDTELIALRSGTTSIDQEIFKGYVTLPKKVEYAKKLDKFNLNILFNKFENMIGDNKIYPNKFNLTKYVAENKYFSFIIDEKYEGNKLSVTELSKILTKISSFDPALGVIVMVPNSLGPGELITHYGTKEQKNKYLPGLSKGTYIPCFGLTGPNNGSDATGSIDTGKIITKDNELYIDIEINKRYITLAPVANLVGLAFRVEDPDKLLSNGKSGITVALIEKDHPGLEMLTHHNPLDTGFPNGTLKGHLQIPLSNIIGGEKNIGEGWKMLMECLAAGRGICLPASANAGAKVATFGIHQYIKHRKQFKIPLIKMEGIQQKYIDMLFHTWCIHSSIALTNNILDSGEKPAVISAIMKQQTTDRAREILNNAMDIHAGGAICKGYSNFLEKFYRSLPIGITVEGSNILTRNLIIFGQGLNKSHPYIYPVLESILNNNQNHFNTAFKDIVNHSLNTYFTTFVLHATEPLEKQTIQFAALSNFIALKGGSLKAEQYLSGDMADVFSNLYIAHSIRWYHKHYNTSKILTDYCINRLINENTTIINRVIENNNYLKPFLFHIKKRSKSASYNDNKKVIEEVLNNNKIINTIKDDIEITGILKDLETLDTVQIKDYENIYNKVINVGEYTNY